MYSKSELRSTRNPDPQKMIGAVDVGILGNDEACYIIGGSGNQAKGKWEVKKLWCSMEKTHGWIRTPRQGTNSANW